MVQRSKPPAVAAAANQLASRRRGETVVPEANPATATGLEKLCPAPRGDKQRGIALKAFIDTNEHRTIAQVSSAAVSEKRRSRTSVTPRCNKSRIEDDDQSTVVSTVSNPDFTTLRPVRRERHRNSSAAAGPATAKRIPRDVTRSDSHNKGSATTRATTRASSRGSHRVSPVQKPNDLSVPSAAMMRLGHSVMTTMTGTKKKQEKTAAAACKWRTATDPKTGKTYYYHVETRETQWRKPIELATPEERREVEEKELRQREFFAAMEANILKSMEAGAFAAEEGNGKEESQHHPSTTETNSNNTLVSSDEPNHPLSQNSSGGVGRPKMEKPRLVRTISSMDENILKDLVHRVPSHSLLCSRGDLNYDYEADLNDSFKINTADVNDDSPNTIVALNNMSISQIPRPARIPRLGSIREDIEENAAVQAARAMVAEQADADDGLETTDGASSTGRISSTGSRSIAGILNALPNASGTSSSLEASMLSSYGLNETMDSSIVDAKESEALRQLAEITEKMSHVQEDDPSSELSMDGLGVESGGVPMSDPPPSHHTLNEDSSSSSAPPSPLDSLPPIARPRAAMARRNTCGTLYVGTTMSQPDKDATIKVSQFRKKNMLYASTSFA